MIKHDKVNAALSIYLFLFFPSFAHILIFSSRFGKSVLSPSLTKQHIVDHLLVCLAVAVGQWREWVAHLYRVRDQVMVPYVQKLTISRTHLSLYFAATAAVLPGPAAAPCIVPALACNEMHLRKDF